MKILIVQFLLGIIRESFQKLNWKKQEIILEKKVTKFIYKIKVAFKIKIIIKMTNNKISL